MQQPSAQQQPAMDQHQFYYASLPTASGAQMQYHPSQYAQPQPAYYTQDQQAQYMMSTGGQAMPQPVMMQIPGQPYSFAYMPPAPPGMAPAAYPPHAYFTAAPQPAVYYPPEMYMQAQQRHVPVSGTEGNEGLAASSVRPLSTSTPLPELTVGPPPMTNQLPYAGNIKTAYLKYHRSVDADDVLANLSKISMASDTADDTMCDSNERQHEMPLQQLHPQQHQHQQMSHRGAGMYHQQQQPSNYKTRLCMTFASGKNCDMGGRCNFAHGLEELRHVELPSRAPNMKYKTRLCKNYATAYISQNGEQQRPFCPYGLRCEFIHPTDKEFAQLPRHVRNTIAPSVLAVTNTNPADVTPEMLSDYHDSPVVTRSAAKPAAEKVLLKNRNVAGSMMCLASAGRRDGQSDDSAICSGSSESGSSLGGRMRYNFMNGGLPMKFARRRSMSQLSLKKWNSSEAVNENRV